VSFPLRLALLSVGFVAYYWWAIGAGRSRARSVSRALLTRLRVATRHSVDQIESVAGLAIASVGQLCFCAFAITVSGVTVGSLVPDTFRPVLLLYGLALGIGEAALASFLAYATFRALDAAKSGTRRDHQGWLAISRGGWMRFYLRTAEVAPWPVLVGLTTLYITVEELFFRGVLVGMFEPHGNVLAVVVPTIFFMLVQTFHMPSWQSALFPLVGAMVVGVIHSAMYLAVPDLTPLIVAHMTLFLITVL
jgi:hypothetical protein